MDCGPKKHDVCKDPELKADPDIAGIGVSYLFFFRGGKTLLILIFRFFFSAYTQRYVKLKSKWGE